MINADRKLLITVSKTFSFENKTIIIILMFTSFLWSDYNIENAYLRHLTYIGAKRRYLKLNDEIKSRIDFELKVIQFEARGEIECTGEKRVYREK